MAWGFTIVQREQLMSDSLIEGTLYIQSKDHDWGVSFVPNTPGAHGSTGTHPGEGEEELVGFLQQLSIPQERIQGALKELRLHGNVSMHPVRSSSEQIQRYGL
jgi:hypothetical protein